MKARQAKKALNALSLNIMTNAFSNMFPHAPYNGTSTYHSNRVETLEGYLRSDGYITKRYTYIDRLLLDPIVHRVVSIPAEDAFRGEFKIICQDERLDADDLIMLNTEFKNAIVDTYDQLTIPKLLERAAFQVRAFGGSSIIIEPSIEEGLDNNIEQQKPLDLEKIVYDPENLTFAAYAAEPREVVFPLANNMRRAIDNQGEFCTFLNYRLHQTRVLKILGQHISNRTNALFNGYGASILEFLVTSINEAGKGKAAIFQLMDEAKITMFSNPMIDTLYSDQQIQGYGNQEVTRALMDHMEKLLSVANNYNKILAPKDSKLEQIQVDFSKLTDALKYLSKSFISASGVPEVKIFGANSENQGLIQNDSPILKEYHKSTVVPLREKFRPAVLFFAKLIAKNKLGFIPNGIDVEFPPQVDLTEIQENQIKSTKLEQILQLKNNKLITKQYANKMINELGIFSTPLDVDKIPDEFEVISDYSAVYSDVTDQNNEEQNPLNKKVEEKQDFKSIIKKLFKSTSNDS